MPTAAVQAQNVGEQMLTRELTLNLGDQLVLSADGVKSFSEGLKGIIDVRLTKDNTKFVVLGLRAGETTLLFIMDDGSKINHEIAVVDPNAQPQEKRGLVEVRDNIRLDFYFVQLSNNYSHNIGLGWPGTFGADGSASFAMDLQTGTLTSASAVVSQALPRLDLAQADGWAKLQRKASVITANGTQASFSGGGEVNVIVSGGFGGSIQRVSFGSQIGVLPLYDRESGRIELQINADVSDLTPAVGDVPGRTTSQLKTVVNLELGQSIVLAGLSATSETAGQAGLPGLSQIPVLGVLFGSHARTTTETENVVFIVPTVMDTVSTDARRHIQEALQAYEEFSGDFDDVTRPARFKSLGGGRRR
ncbi:MAG: hypothetical protein OXR73_18365 [Myxococcales bacterium]|nr:hypothetical protein [Myxococcales bacterium]